MLDRDRHLDSRHATLGLSLQINRSLYDTSNLTSLLACNLTYSSSDCAQDLPRGSRRYALLLGGDSPDMETGYYPVRSFTNRHWLYAVAFGIPSVVGTVLFALFLYALCKRCRKAQNTTSTTTTTTTTNTATTPPRYPTDSETARLVVPTAPKPSVQFSSLGRTPGMDDTVPSYEQATAMPPIYPTVATTT